MTSHLLPAAVVLFCLAWASSAAAQENLPKRGAKVRGDEFSAGMLFLDSAEARASCPLLCESVGKRWNNRWANLDHPEVSTCTCTPIPTRELDPQTKNTDDFNSTLDTPDDLDPTDLDPTDALDQDLPDDIDDPEDLDDLEIDPSFDPG